MKPKHDWNYKMAYKKWFWLRFILLLVVLALSIALARITFCERDKYNDYAFNHNNSPFVKTSVTTNDWHTYKNDTYGFEFKYPANVKIAEVVNPEETDAAFEVEIKTPEGDEEKEVYVRIYDKDLNESLFNVFKNHDVPNEPKVVKKETVIAQIFGLDVPDDAVVAAIKTSFKFTN